MWNCVMVYGDVHSGQDGETDAHQKIVKKLPSCLLWFRRLTPDDVDEYFFTGYVTIHYIQS